LEVTAMSAEKDANRQQRPILVYALFAFFAVKILACFSDYVQPMPRPEATDLTARSTKTAK